MQSFLKSGFLDKIQQNNENFYQKSLLPFVLTESRKCKSVKF